MSTMIIGVDPGASGALVALLDGQPVEWLHMPTLARGTQTRVNGAQVRAWLIDRAAQAGGWAKIHCYIEAVSAMPGQGTRSMFSFGHAAGMLEGVIQASGLSHTFVTPQSWKKRAGIATGADKDAARSRAIELWPEWRALDAKGKGQALADAALIALYGSRNVS